MIPKSWDHVKISEDPSSPWWLHKNYPLRLFTSIAGLLKRVEGPSCLFCRHPQFLPDVLQGSGTFLTSGTSFVEDSFPTDWHGGNGFRMIQAHYFYCALYFCYYYISSISDHQALDSRHWGPLFKRIS